MCLFFKNDLVTHIDLLNFIYLWLWEIDVYFIVQFRLKKNIVA